MCELITDILRREDWKKINVIADFIRKIGKIV